MSKSQNLKAVVKQRLTAAVEEIFGLFERTVAEYEEEVTRSQEEIDQQRNLLDAVWLHREALPPDLQQLLVIGERFPAEQQEWSPSLHQEDSDMKDEQGDLWISQEREQLQEDPEPPHIKEEQEELWVSQEGEQLQGLQEADITKFSFTPVPVKRDDEENPHSSQLHQSQTEDNRKAEPLASCSTEQMKISDAEDCGGSDSERAKNLYLILYPASNSQPTEPQLGLYSKKNSEVLGEKVFSCSVCGKLFGNEADMTTHMIVHTGLKIFDCSVCGKSFGSAPHLKRHMLVHTGEKKFNCSVCGKGFGLKANLKSHMIVHTGEKQFNCSVCGRSFGRNENLKGHMVIHTGETQFNCSICGKGFGHKGSLKKHMIVHTGETQFFCSVCGKAFSQNGSLKTHMKLHYRNVGASSFQGQRILPQLLPK